MNNDLGKYLIIGGSLILIAGIAIYYFGDYLRWIGRLPGDIRIEKQNFRFYFPITTLLLLNAVIFLIIRLWKWLNP